ncbi:hypothetical protein BKA83DRAFT_4120677 [Pisolithus microcarpus]|nr:hypothetical protein BKA83DRAFT_4120677 [Pisolithus microcarpus]
MTLRQSEGYSLRYTRRGVVEKRADTLRRGLACNNTGSAEPCASIVNHRLDADQTVSWSCQREIQPEAVKRVTRLTFRPPPAPPGQHNNLTTTYPTQYPTAVAEVAIAAQLERLRVTEALAARGSVVVRLEDAYTSVRQKSAIKSRLERELEILRRSSTPSSMNPSVLQDGRCIDSCPGAEDQTDDEKGINSAGHVRSDSPSSWVRITTPPKTTYLGGHAARTSRASDKLVPFVNDDLKEKIAMSLLSLEGGIEKIIAARHSTLAALPLPSDIPEEGL